MPEDEGGGFIVLVPDLPGCMSDGEMVKSALASVMEAVAAWPRCSAALCRRPHVIFKLRNDHRGATALGTAISKKNFMSK